MKKSDQNILRLVKTWQFMLLVLLFAFSADAFALQQLTNTGFNTNTTGWTRVSSVNAPYAFATNNRVAGAGNPGASFQMRYDRNGTARQADGMVWQAFTPGGAVYASLYFDYKRIRTNSPPSYYLSGNICSNTGVVLFTPFDESFSATTYDNTTWFNTGWTAPVLLAANTYRLRVFCDVTCSTVGRLSGADIDNIQVNISPAELTGYTSASDNIMSWTGSVGAATLDHYQLYYSTDGVSYSAAGTTAGTNITHSPPTLETVVYYRVSDVDTTGLESPQSVEWPIIRMDVRDGSGADVDCLAANDIPMNWVTPVITKTGYQVALGTTPGGSDIVTWTNKGAAATSHVFTGVSLSAAVQYYASIRVVNGAVTYNSSSSDGFKRPEVRDGTGADESVSSSLTDCSMNWDAAGDAARYEVALGTSAGASDIVAWTNVGAATAYNFTGLSLANDTTYYCSIRVYNAADTLLGTFSSNGFLALINFSTTVSDGQGSDVDAWATNTSVDINWVDVPISKVRYEAALGTTPGGTNIKGWTDMALATSGTLSGLALVNGTTYYCSVRIVHSTGPLPADSSDGFTFYNIGVRDGTGADEDYTLFPNMIKCNWDAFPAPILRYEVAVGNAPGDTSISGGWINKGISTGATVSGLTLVDGNIYYCSVRVIDLGGNAIGWASSNGTQVTLPTAITVRDGLGPDIGSSFFENRVEANWDHPAIALVRYEMAVGTSQYDEDICPFTDVGHANRAAATTGILEDARKYYVTIRGINPFGVVQALGASDGFTARKEQVLVDTASQSYFNNARVIDRVAIANDSISPVNFQGTGGTVGYWPYRMQVTVTEPGITERINAPCRVQFNIPVAGQRPGLVREFRVADEHGNELPRYNLPTGSTTNPDIVFLVNMGKSETKTYWIYWGNTSVSDPAYGFATNTSQISSVAWTPYYTRKTLLPGIETTPLAYNYGYREQPPSVNHPGISAPETTAEEFEYFTNSYAGNYYYNATTPGGTWRDDARSNLVTDIFGGAGGSFYFFGTNNRNWRVWLNGLLYGNIAGTEISANNKWSTCDFTNGDFDTRQRFRSGIICPFWADLRYSSPGYPDNPGVFRDSMPSPSREVFTWRMNNWLPAGAEDDVYIFQTVIYGSSDIAHRYQNLSPRSTTGGSTSIPVVNVHLTAGLGAIDDNTVAAGNRRFLRNTPLNIGIGKTPGSFFQCMDAFRGNYTTGAIVGGAVGTWVDVGHFESMVFDSRVANPVWQEMKYECVGTTDHRMLLATRSGPTPLPDGSWSAWSADVTATPPNGSLTLTSTNRYIQYRCIFQRKGNTGTVSRLDKVEFVYGGISIEEVKATTPDGVSQGQSGIPVEVVIRNFYSDPVKLQSAELTFSLGTHTPSTTLIPGTEIPAGGTISVFFTVDVDVNSPIGTATIDARATATVAVPALTFYDADAQITDEWRIRSKAQLVIDQVETEPTHVNKGQSDIYVRMHISNIGETPFALTSATLQFIDGLYSQVVLQTPSLGTIIPELSSFIATFTVDVDTNSPSGDSVICGAASGTSTFSGLLTEDTVTVPPRTDTWNIQNKAQLILQEIVASETVYRGQVNTPVFLRVLNSGEADARWISSSIIPYFSLGIYDAEYPVTPFEIIIPGGFESVARYGVDISPVSDVGTSIVDASVSGKDVNNGLPVNCIGALLPGEWTILAEKINTFKDAALTQSSVSFNRPSAGSLTVYAKAENLNPFGGFVIRWLDQDDNIIAESGFIYADSDGVLSHHMDITPVSDYGVYKVRVTNAINTVISCENQFEIVSPAVLGSLFSLPAQVTVGQPFTGSFTFDNTGGAAITSAYTSALQLSGAGSAVQTSPLPPLTNVAGYGQATVTFDFVAQTAGNFAASATAYGFDANSGKALHTAGLKSNDCNIQSKPDVKHNSIAAVPAGLSTVYLNQKNLRITVNVTNDTAVITNEASAILQAASITFSLGSYDQTLISPALPYTLAGGGNVDLVYDISIHADSATGNSVFTPNLLWCDRNWPASVTWLVSVPPTSAQWEIKPVGIQLSSVSSYNPLQSDFCPGQTLYVRGYGLTPGSIPPLATDWHRIRIYKAPPIAQAGTSPTGWFLVSPPLSPDADGLIDAEFVLDASVGTWSVVVENDTDMNSTTPGDMLGLQYFKVQNPGDLVASLSISPSSVFVGENFTVTMIATNSVTTGSTISNASPEALIPAATFPDFGGSATMISGPTPASVTVKALQAGSLSYTYRADTNTGMNGSYSLTVAPSWYCAGYDLNTRNLVKSGKGVSNPLKIYSRSILMTPDSMDFGSMLCGDTLKVDGIVKNNGNVQLEKVKWITADINGPGAPISKINLDMSPDPIGSIAGDVDQNASATLFIPYWQEAGDYIATMSVYHDRNNNELKDIDESYDRFNVKVNVPSCKRIFAQQDLIDLGACPIGQSSIGGILNFFSGGNDDLEDVKIMQIVGTNTAHFPIVCAPANPGYMAIKGTGVANLVADSVANAGIYIATWTIWNDASAPFGSVNGTEASDTFQVRVQVGIMNFTVAPSPLDAGTIEPSAFKLAIPLTLTNDALGLPLTRLKLEKNDLADGSGNTIASSQVGLNNLIHPIPAVVEAGQAITIDVALSVEAGKIAGTYTGTQYIYHDDNGDGDRDPLEANAPFDLRVVVPPVPRVQVMATTIGVGGIKPDSSKIFTFTCRNTGNIDLTDLKWKIAPLIGPDTIDALDISFPPAGSFSAARGAFFTRQIRVQVPAGKPYGIYESMPLAFWLWADMEAPADVINPTEASCTFKVNCEVGDLLVDITDAGLTSSGSPNAASTLKTFNVVNAGSLALVNLKATGSLLIPAVAGPPDIPATANVFSPSANLGGLSAGQPVNPKWSVNIPANTPDGVYNGSITVWEDGDYNGIREAGEAFDTCPVQLTVNKTPALDIVQTQLNLGWVAKNSSRQGQIEIRNVGNVAVDSLQALTAPLVYASNNIPAASITIETLPPMPISIPVGGSVLATVTVTIGAIQALAEYSGNQTIKSFWGAVAASDLFELIISIGSKVIYETNSTNPPVDFSSRDVNGTYNKAVTVFSGAVPLDRVRWKVLTPLTGSLYSFPVASLTFSPAASQYISGSRAYQANAEVGMPPAGFYVATAAFYDDFDDDQIIDNPEASATFQVWLTVNPYEAIDLLKTEIDFGNMAAGENKILEVGFKNIGNVVLNTSDLDWSFNDLASLTFPAHIIPSSQLQCLSYTMATVSPGAVASANIRLTIPAGQTNDVYGPSGLQRLFKGVVGDNCDFRVEVGGEPPAQVNKHSIYQDVNPALFTPPVPPQTDLYFLSAWVCPGSGSADLAFIQYDAAGTALATISATIKADGTLSVSDPHASFKAVHSGICETEPIDLTLPDSSIESSKYFRVYFAFNLVEDVPDIGADSLKIILHNSSPMVGQAVWFDGIKLERAFDGQTRPTTWHSGATLFSPRKEHSLNGDHQYYEW